MGSSAFEFVIVEVRYQIHRLIHGALNECDLLSESKLSAHSVYSNETTFNSKQAVIERKKNGKNRTKQIDSNSTDRKYPSCTSQPQKPCESDIAVEAGHIR